MQWRAAAVVIVGILSVGCQQPEPAPNTVATFESGVGAAGAGQPASRAPAATTAAVPEPTTLSAATMVPSPAAPEPTPAVPEAAIPADFRTYEETELFSISYPPDWELVPSIAAEAVERVAFSFQFGVPVDEPSVVFFAGLPTDTGWLPNMNILVAPLPSPATSHDEQVEAEVQGLEVALQDYREVSRVRTIVDGRETTLLDYTGSVPGVGEFHILASIAVVGQSAWVVSGTAPSEEFGRWMTDFEAAVRSFRILASTARFVQ